MKTRKILTALCVIAVVLALFTACSKSRSLSFYDDQELISSTKLKEGAEVLEPTVPTKEGLTFGGWYKDIDNTEKYEFPGKMPGEDLDLYASWLVTLSFDANGGQSVPSIVAKAKAVIELPDPVRENYIFVGWFTSKDFQTKQGVVMPTKNTTVYAKWQVLEEGTKITLDGEWYNNDAVAYNVSKEENGDKFVATAGKFEYSFVKKTINVNAKENTAIVINLKGTKDCEILFKVEGGDATASEKVFVLTGEDQKITWTVDPENLTAVGGQMFLFFLRPGQLGCSETPEYVIIKDVTLFKTVDADAPQSVALRFVENGGSDVLDIYAPAGSAITKPADPEKPGYAFLGWFADPAFKNELTFDKMPSSATVAYAKWQKEGTKLPELDLIKATWEQLDPDTYEFAVNEGVLTIKKTTANEWSFAKVAMDGFAVAGLDVLKVTIKGTAGDRIMFKINDAVEKWITCNGLVQVFEFKFDIPLDSTKPLIICALSNNVFEVSKVSYSNYQENISVLEGWVENDPDTYTIKNENGTLSLAKSGGEWIFAKKELTGLAIAEEFNMFRIIVKGEAGKEVIVKVNDAIETKILLDGTIQTVEWELSQAVNVEKPLLIFAECGVVGTSSEMVFYALDLYTVAVEEEKVEDVNIISGWVENDPDTYEIKEENGALSLKKTGVGEWIFAKLIIEDKPITDKHNVMHMVIKGVAGKEILFKVNDAVEIKVVCDGTFQTIDWVIPQEINKEKFLIIFAECGVAGTGSEFVISELTLTTNKKVDLISGWVENDPETYEIKEENGALSLKKTGAGEWIFAKLVITEKEITEDHNVMHIAVKGEVGKEILFKVNDAIETKVVCDGTVQVVDWKLSQEVIKDKFLIIFAECGVAGTGSEFVISELYLTSDKSIDILSGWVENDPSTYEIKEEAGVLSLKKTGAGEWIFAKKVIEGLAIDEAYNCMQIVVKGEAGKEILFKVNDAIETKVVCTGDWQFVNWQLSQPVNPEKFLIIFAECGVAGTGSEFLISSLKFVQK